MKSESATDLPAPGSPPSSRLRSGRPTETALPSSSTPRESGSHSEPVGIGHGGAGTDSGSRNRIETWANEALAGSRTTRTSRAPMVAASVSLGLVELLGAEARRQAKPEALPGRDRLAASTIEEADHGG